MNFYCYFILNKNRWAGKNKSNFKKSKNNVYICRPKTGNRSSFPEEIDGCCIEIAPFRATSFKKHKGAFSVL